MNRDQTNQTGMFDTVSAYMTKNNTLWNGVPAIVATLADFTAGNAAIDGVAGKQQVPTTGLADAKAAVRHDYEEHILVIADQLSALAALLRNADLSAKTDLTLSSLDKETDDDLVETGKLISTLATANMAALADYGILPADVTALDALKVQFIGMKNSPRTAVATRAGETATLPDLIKNQMSLLRNRLDKLMTRFKKTQPEFYAGYQSARVIVDRGGTKPAAKPAPTPTPKPV